LGGLLNTEKGIANMNEVEKEVLKKFVELLRIYPNGNVGFMWFEAGGKFAAQQGVHPTLLTLCPECGVEQIVTHLPTCAHYVAQSG
jgi:hypothetical protein